MSGFVLVFWAGFLPFVLACLSAAKVELNPEKWTFLPWIVSAYICYAETLEHQVIKSPFAIRTCTWLSGKEGGRGDSEVKKGEKWSQEFLFFKMVLFSSSRLKSDLFLNRIVSCWKERLWGESFISCCAVESTSLDWKDFDGWILIVFVVFAVLWHWQMILAAKGEAGWPSLSSFHDNLAFLNNLGL